MNDAFEEALKRLTEALLDINERLEQLADAARGKLEDERLIYYERERLIPPRSVSRARSPDIRRYWINYRARDKVPQKRLKSGGNRNAKGQAK